MKRGDFCDGPQKKEAVLLSPEDRRDFGRIQECIQATIEERNPGKFRFSSGWRGVFGNRAVGGKAKSRHLLALACDIVPLDGDFSCPPDVPGWLRVVRSNGCWHVEVM